MSEPSPAVPIWHCEFSALGSEELTNLTVGSKFAMKCHGDIAVEWQNNQPLTMGFQKPDDQYTLAVLKIAKLEPQDAEFVVTGYKAGKHKPEYIRFLKGSSGFEAAKPEWDIQSVLKQGEKPQLYGPYGPFHLGLPLWIVLTAALLIGLVTFFIVRRVRKGVQRRRMLEDLKRHRTAMLPIHQFYRDARNLRKRIHTAKVAEELKAIAEDLNRDFRLYVLRQFEIPTLEWSDPAILRELRQRHRKVWVASADPLRKTLRELGRLKVESTVLLEDVEQLHHMSMDTAERLEKAREGVSK